MKCGIFLWNHLATFQNGHFLRYKRMKSHSRRKLPYPKVSFHQQYIYIDMYMCVCEFELNTFYISLRDNLCIYKEMTKHSYYDILLNTYISNVNVNTFSCIRNVVLLRNLWEKFFSETSCLSLFLMFCSHRRYIMVFYNDFSAETNSEKLLLVSFRHENVHARSNAHRLPK